jgi:RNA polymerase sigma-70 factor (ECF subfamily)
MSNDPRSSTDAAAGMTRSARGAPLAPATCAQLMIQQKDRIAALAWRLLGWRRESVEDVVQDVFLVAFQNVSQFRGHAKPETWLYRIVVNQCRRHRRMRFLRLRFRTSAEVPEPQSGSPAIDAETRAQVRQAVAALSLPNREVVVLRYLEGLTTPEIAAIVGRSPNAVEVRLNRARAALRAALGPLLQE